MEERIGRYAIERRLGAGGMGVVFLAHDPELDRRVALKLVRCEGRRFPVGAHARLAREAQALARLSHPNVTAVFDVGESDDGLFVAMEYVEGVTLGEWMAWPRTWRAIVDVFESAARGLAAAHGLGLVHRDFKPDNVMVGVDGRVRVLDFGLAVLLLDDPEISIDIDEEATLRTRLTVTGAVMGTPVYMAPEQMRGEAPDARSDQYSFCVALYEALFNVRPFQGSTRIELADAKRCVPDVPRESDVPRWLRRVVLRGLAPDARDRWPSMDALLRALRPARRIPPRIAIASTVVLPAALLGVAYGTATRADDPCLDAARELDAAWSSSRDDVREAMLASRLAYAKDSWNRVEQSTDAYLAQWGASRRDACEASASAEIDARVACLDRAAVAFGAMIDVLSDRDAPVVEAAMQTVAGLPSLDACADPNAMRSAIDPPAPSIALEVARTRSDVAQARALETAGQYAAGLDLARASLARAERTGYAPLIAESLVVLGKLAMRATQMEESTSSLERAAALGVELRHDEVALEAMMLLAGVRGYVEVRTEEGLHWWHSADALASRGVDLETRVFLDNIKGGILFRQEDIREAKATWTRSLARLGDPQTPAQRNLLVATLNNLGSVYAVESAWDEAETTLRRAVDEAITLHGPQHPVVTTAMVNLSNVLREAGKFDAALAMQRDAMQAWERSLGPEHPYVATALANLAMLSRSAGRTDDALAHFERSIAIKRKALGPRHPDLALSLNNYGDLLRETGRPEAARDAHLEATEIWRLHGDSPEWLTFGLTNLGYDLLALDRADEALPLLEEALDVQQRWQLSPPGLAETELALARTLDALGRDPDRARELAEHAERIFEDTGGRYLEERDEASLWLAEHAR